MSKTTVYEMEDMEIIDLINKIGMKIKVNKQEDSHFDCNVIS